MNDLEYFHDVACIVRRSVKDRRATKVATSYCPDMRYHADRRSGIDRRKARRYPLERFTFVKLFSDSDEDIGQLLEISDTGLSFRYLATRGEPKKFSKLSILWSNRDFAVAGLTVRTLSDTLMNEGSEFNPIIFRRAGVQFENMTVRQQSELSDFLNQQTLD